jgi:ATP-dependent helicase/nuclease subunit A
MPSTLLTAEQSRAITTRDVSVALSAGAGCGKTFVLTERFLSHLVGATGDAQGQPARLHQLIAITFTDAAAREMRQRIRDACYERLQRAETADEQQRWQRLLREIDTARISTIHSFCASLLREHAATAGLDPTFAVLDQGDADVLLYEMIDDTLRRQLVALDDETLDLAAVYGLGQLKQQIAAMLDERHQPYFLTWQSATPQDLVARWQKWHEEQAFPNALREIAAEACLDEILELLNDVTTSKPSFVEARHKLQHLLPRLRERKISREELEHICDFARVRARDRKAICTAKDFDDKASYEAYSSACEALRKCIDKHQPARWNEQIAYQAAKRGLALLRLTAKVVKAYDDRKAALGRLDFDDLLSRAYALVSDPQNESVRERFARDLHLLLVDEFQDTDQLQVDLVRALCGSGFDAGRLFFVGDFKQSIYRFRGAAPKVFRDLRAQVDERGRLPLNVNFRSQPGVLHFINALFCDVFSNDSLPLANPKSDSLPLANPESDSLPLAGRAGEGVGADEKYEPLQPSRKQITQPPAVEFLWTIAPNKHSHHKGEAQKARQQEARALACRLAELLNSDCQERPVVDKNTGEPRALRPGDVAILFRAMSDVHIYEEALREFGLEYYLVGGHAFYAQQEIYDVLNLLRAVASMADELSLAGALRSPFFSLADETLFWLVDSGGSLNAGLLAEHLPTQLSLEERAKASAAADTIRALRSLKDRVPIATLLGEALDRTGYDAVLLAEFLGERKLANLHKLLERARAADAGVMDLDGFITQLAQFIVREPKEALAATLPEAADIIRLMTIHHAKGLEFPLVVVPDLDRPANIRQPCAALHPDLGPLVPQPLDDENEKAATGMTLFAALDRAEELEERKRLLYVACTRAADCLILSSSLADFENPKSDWMKLIGERFELETGVLITCLPKGYESLRVRVTPQPQSDEKTLGKSRGPDLLKMLEDAQHLAADGDGLIPREVDAVPADRTARRQFSFSRLTGQLMRKNEHGANAGEIDPARFQEQEARIDPLRLGSLVHDVLARVDYGANGNADDIGRWCEHLASQYVLLNADEAAASAREMLERFAASPRAKRLALSRAIHREVEFLLAWPPGSYLHGYIDCLYQDAEGRWRLIDFKTTKATAADVARMARQYEMQMYVYALAAERALGEPPAELALYFLRPGVEYTFPWNDAARRRAEDLVNQAIASQLDSDWSLQRPV